MSIKNGLETELDIEKRLEYQLSYAITYGRIEIRLPIWCDRRRYVDES